ncbi:MAG: hypothetical protein R2793_05610 [Flavobacteriaceae bacterium]
MNNPPGKSKAIVAYLTFVGFFISLSMNQDPKDSFTTWHLRNMFGLLILLFVAVSLQNAAGYYLYWLSAACWLFCLFMAIAGKQIGIPFLSEKFQVWFRFLG